MSTVPPGPDLRPLPAPPAPGAGAPPTAEPSTPPAPPAPSAPSPRRRWWRAAGLAAVAAAGCAYVALYDPSSSSALYPRCPFKELTGWDCPGCGVTRALHSLFTGDVARALDHNVVFVLALPVLLYLLVQRAATSLGWRPPGPALRWRPWMGVVLPVVVGGFWLARNLPPLSWLAADAG